jgi:small subunit ribosomal protein S6
MIERYSNIVTQRKGKVNRLEDWGRRQLAYPIDKILKAHYVLMNIECDKEAIEELGNAFRYNDAVIRNLILNVKTASTEPSPLLKEREYRSEGGSSSHDSDSRDKSRHKRSHSEDREEVESENDK